MCDGRKVREIRAIEIVEEEDNNKNVFL